MCVHGDLRQCANTLQTELDQFAKKGGLTMFIGVFFALTACK